MSVPVPDRWNCNSGSAANALKTMSLTNAEIDGVRQLVDPVQNHALRSRSRMMCRGMPPPLGTCRFEAILIDLQRSYLRLQRGSWDTQLGSRARGSVHAPSAFPQSALDDGFLLRGTPFEDVKAAVLLSGSRLS